MLRRNSCRFHWLEHFANFIPSTAKLLQADELNHNLYDLNVRAISEEYLLEHLCSQHCQLEQNPFLKDCLINDVFLPDVNHPSISQLRH